MKQQKARHNPMTPDETNFFVLDREEQQQISARRKKINREKVKSKKEIGTARSNPMDVKEANFIGCSFMHDLMNEIKTIGYRTAEQERAYDVLLDMTYDFVDRAEKYMDYPKYNAPVTMEDIRQALLRHESDLTTLGLHEKLPVLIRGQRETRDYYRREVKPKVKQNPDNTARAAIPKAHPALTVPIPAKLVYDVLAVVQEAHDFYMGARDFAVDSIPESIEYTLQTPEPYASIVAHNELCIRVIEASDPQALGRYKRPEPYTDMKGLTSWSKPTIIVHLCNPKAMFSSILQWQRVKETALHELVHFHQMALGVAQYHPNRDRTKTEQMHAISVGLAPKRVRDILYPRNVKQKEYQHESIWIKRPLELKAFITDTSLLIRDELNEMGLSKAKLYDYSSMVLRDAVRREIAKHTTVRYPVVGGFQTSSVVTPAERIELTKMLTTAVVSLLEEEKMPKKSARKNPIGKARDWSPSSSYAIDRAAADFDTATSQLVRLRDEYLTAVQRVTRGRAMLREALLAKTNLQKQVDQLNLQLREGTRLQEENFSDVAKELRREIANLQQRESALRAHVTDSAQWKQRAESAERLLKMADDKNKGDEAYQERKKFMAELTSLQDENKRLRIIAADAEKYEKELLKHEQSKLLGVIAKKNPYDRYILIEDANAPWPDLRKKVETEYEGTKWQYESKFWRYGLPPRFLDEQKTVILLPQLSEKRWPTYVTSFEGRLFIYVCDMKGRRLLFYRSAYGTGGKQQGRWFPSGGLASQCTGDSDDPYTGTWVVKGSSNNPYFNSEDIRALGERVNELMPKSDAEMDAWTKNVLGIPLNLASNALQLQIEPSVRFCELPGKSQLHPRKVSAYCYDVWAHAVRKMWGITKE